VSERQPEPSALSARVADRARYQVGPVNARVVAWLLGGSIASLAVLLLLPVAIALTLDQRADAYPFVYAALIAGAVAGLLYTVGKKTRATIFTAEALVTVALSWIMFGLLGALPFIFSGATDFTDGWFETISGFTTTGSSIFPAVSQLPHALLFWRALTHWVGGLGIILLYLALFPQIGAGAKHLFTHEATGPITETLKPRLRQTARTLWRIYLTLTLANIAALMIFGMGWFDAVCHAFATLATGGFSTQDNSFAHYQSVSLELVTVLFMLLAGVNFSLYSRAYATRSIRVMLRDTEFRVYIGLIAFAVLVVTVSLADTIYPERWLAFRSALFQTVSLHTCTGFATDNANNYPAIAQILLVMVMFLGGSAGSTAGGLKTARIVLLAKLAYREIYRTFRPQAVISVKISGNPVEQDALRTITGFFALAVASYAVGALFLAAFGLDGGTALSAPAACLWGVGPGMSIVGTMGNYSTLPVAVKWFLTALMLLGRLEFFTFLAVLSPSFWRR